MGGTASLRFRIQGQECPVLARVGPLWRWGLHLRGGLHQGLPAQVGKNERGVAGRENTPACLWRLKWTWPVCHGQEGWRWLRRNGSGRSWAVAGASSPPSCPLRARHTTRPTFSTTAETSKGLGCLQDKGAARPSPSRAAAALSGILHVPCPLHPLSPPAIAQPCFPGSAMDIPASVHWLGLFLPPRMPFPFFPASQDQHRRPVSPCSDFPGRMSHLPLSVPTA